MPSVEFSDSYRIQSLGYPTNYVRIDYTEVEYDIASNKTKVRLDGVYIKYTGGTASSRCFGTLKFNGTTMLTMNGSPYQVNVSESYTLVPGTNNGTTVWIQHNEAGAATLTIALSGGTRNDENEDVFGALYYYGSGYPIIGVRTPASKNVSLTTHTRTYTVSINAGTGSSIKVMRGGTTLANGASITYGDVLTITFTPLSGYAINAHTVNGSTFTSGGTHTVTGNVTVAATATAQASTLLSISTSVETQNNVNMQMNRVSTAYWHKTTFLLGGSRLAVSSAFETALSFTVPRSWFSTKPNDVSITIDVSIQTYTDSTCQTAVGNPVTASFTAIADAGMKPTLSSGWATASPYNTGAVSGMSGYIKGYSRAAVSFDSSKITNAAGAGIAKYAISCQGETVSASPYRTGVLTSTSVTITCTVTDTRGRTASGTITLSVMDYYRPLLSDILVYRSNSEGVADGEGTFFLVKATLTFSSLNNQNTCSLSVAYAETQGSYGAETVLTSATQKILGTISVDKSYTARITATDSLGNSTVYYANIPSRKWAMKFRPDGDGVAFGKAAEYDKTFEIADDWAVKSKGIVDLIYPVGSIYMSVNSTSPATIFGGTWERIQDRFLLAAGSTYAAGSTGGEAAHTLTVDEIPSHRHGLTDSPANSAGRAGTGTSRFGTVQMDVVWANGYLTDATGSGQAHNNMPPYLAVYMWKRTA